MKSKRANLARACLVTLGNRWYRSFFHRGLIFQDSCKTGLFCSRCITKPYQEINRIVYRVEWLGLQHFEQNLPDRTDLSVVQFPLVSNFLFKAINNDPASRALPFLCVLEATLSCSKAVLITLNHCLLPWYRTVCHIHPSCADVCPNTDKPIFVEKICIKNKRTNLRERHIFESCNFNCIKKILEKSKKRMKLSV